MLSLITETGSLMKTMLSTINESPRVSPTVKSASKEIQQDLATGQLDPVQLQQRLLERFGDDALGIVDEGGQIDFARLQDLLQQQFSKMQEQLNNPNHLNAFLNNQHQRDTNSLFTLVA